MATPSFEAMLRQGKEPLPTPPHFSPATRVALMYALFAGLWILLSDMLLRLLAETGNEITAWSIAKGWLFVLITALLLHALVRREFLAKRRTDVALERAHRALKAVSRCNQVVSRAADESALLQEICRIAVEVGGYHKAWVGYAQPSVTQGVQPMAHAGFKNLAPDTTTPIACWAEAGHGPTDEAIRTNTPVLIQNIAVDPVYRPWSARATACGCVSLIALPFRIDERTSGALTLCMAEPSFFDPEETRLLRELADNMAFGIHALRLRAEFSLAEESLRRNEARLRMLTTHTSAYIAELNRQGIILFANRNSQEFTEKPVEGTFLSDWFPEEQAAAFHSVLARVFAFGQAQTLEYTLPNPKGEERTYSATIAPILDPAEPMRVTFTATDITDRKRTEEQLKKSYAQLRETQTQLVQSAKLAAVGRMSAGIAHEINNPLASILSSTDILAETVNLPGISLDMRRETLLRHIGKIQHNIGRARGIIDSLLGFVRQGGGEVADLDMVAILVNTLAVIASGARSGAQNIAKLNRPLTLDMDWAAAAANAREFPPARMRIKGRIGQMEQVFLNLIQNAMDATAQDGIILVSYLEEADGVIISVGDNGIGIAEEQLKHVFEPFFTTKELGKGTGLGLYVSHQIVTGCGGRIECESQAGRGTVVRVWLPGRQHKGSP